MVCLLAAPWVQLSVSAGNGWPHNALRHHRLMPISCHFRDCKAPLVTSLTHVSGAIASVQTFTFFYLYNIKTRNWEKSTLLIDRLKALTLLKSVDGGRLFQLLITRLAKKRLLSELVGYKVYTACMHVPSLLTRYITGKIITCYINETEHYFIAP